MPLSQGLTLAPVRLGTGATDEDERLAFAGDLLVAALGCLAEGHDDAGHQMPRSAITQSSFESGRAASGQKLPRRLCAYLGGSRGVVAFRKADMAPIRWQVDVWLPGRPR
jgi:hypothetical protein